MEDYTPPSILYRYFSADGAIKTLETGSLRFANFEDLNDPQEFCYSRYELTDDDVESIVADPTFQKIHGQLFNKLCKESGEEKAKEWIKEFDLQPWKTGKIHEVIEDWKKKFAICSFSSTKDDPAMWAYYTTGEKKGPWSGAVIAFGVDIREFPLQCRKVEYVEKPLPFSFVQNLIQNGKLILKMAHTKSIAWEHEDEYRLFAPKGIDVPGYESFSPEKKAAYQERFQMKDKHFFMIFLPSAVKAVYYGMNMTDDDKQDLDSILHCEAYLHVDIYHMKRSQGESFMPISHLIRAGKRD